MKWIKITTTLLILLFAGLALSEPSSDPWNLKRVAVINLPFRNATVRPLMDGKTIELNLPEWNERTEATLLKALFSSSLNHRLHRSRMGAMSVEVYSSTSDIDFSAGKKARSTYVLIGEVRAGKQVMDMFGAKGVDAIPKRIVEKLMSGRFIEAKIALRDMYQSDRKKEKNTQFALLRKSRMSLFDVLGGVRQAAKCQPLPPKLTAERDTESALLTAWCHYFKRNGKTAKQILSKIDAAGPSQSVEKRARELTMKMALGEILFAGRNGNPTLAAKLIVENRKAIMASAPEGLLLEILGQDLIRAGFGGIFSEMAQRLMAGANTAQMDRMSPVMSEAFFAMGQRVRASDSASYFLTRRQPAWIEGRLRRIRGLVHLQEGNWTAAMEDLEAAQTLIGFQNFEDQLALANARLFAGSNETEEGSTFAIDTEENRKNASANPLRKEWFDRVFAELELGENRVPDREVLGKLPGHILYRAYQTAKQNNNEEAATLLLEMAAKKDSEWGKLAKITQKTEDLRRHVEIAKRMMK